MSKYLYSIMHLPLQRYLKWWLDKRASIEEFIVGFSNENPAYLINCLKASFISFKLGGRTVQDGTPTPENPIPIQNVEGNIQIKKCNKNLFSPSGFEAGLVTGKIKNDSGTEINDSTSTYSTYTIPVKANEPISVYGWFQQVYFYDKNMNWIRRSPSGAQGVSVPMVDVFTPTVDGYIQFQIQNNGYNNNKGQEQVEYGSTHTSYVAHAEKTYNFPLSEGQKLMEDGKIENKIINTRRQIVLNNSEYENWISDVSNNVYRFVARGLAGIVKNSGNLLSNKFINDNTSINLYTNGYCSVRGNGSVSFCKSDISSLNDWKAYIEENPILIEAELATPDETNFTLEQQAVLDEIIRDGTYKEVTHVEATANINPSMEIEYKQKAGE